MLGASGALAGSISPFAAEVVGYSPAPGQFVRDPEPPPPGEPDPPVFNDPLLALGPPVGGGTSATFGEGLSSLVTLGGFGGSITLAFDHTVQDHPLNPFGMDAIVFGNAFWVFGDPDFRFAECGLIEICLDVYENNCADGPWYLIPGSHITDPTAQYAEQIWDNDWLDPTFPPEDQSWEPPGFFDNSDQRTTSGYLLPADVFGQGTVENPSGDENVEGIFGYADYSPTLILGDINADGFAEDPLMAPEEFYTVPDDPRSTGITGGSGGGDAFDIAWAIDPATGVPANLPGFDVIRITNGVNVVSFLGEVSPEIDAVSDVAPDPFGDHDDDGDIDLKDVAATQNCFDPIGPSGEACRRLDRDGDDRIDWSDAGAQIARMTGPR
ncbi:MAG: hypothetical protein IIB60_04750 [Planctomycetes bacterium]|nr:hypothetical protein [Planctomycetota bacterium]